MKGFIPEIKPEHVQINEAGQRRVSDQLRIIRQGFSRDLAVHRARHGFSRWDLSVRRARHGFSRWDLSVRRARHGFSFWDLAGHRARH